MRQFFILILTVFVFLVSYLVYIDVALAVPWGEYARFPFFVDFTATPTNSGGETTSLVLYVKVNGGAEMLNCEGVFLIGAPFQITSVKILSVDGPSGSNPSSLVGQTLSLSHSGGAAGFCPNGDGFSASIDEGSPSFNNVANKTNFPVGSYVIRLKAINEGGFERNSEWKTFIVSRAQETAIVTSNLSTTFGFGGDSSFSGCQSPMAAGPDSPGDDWSCTKDGLEGPHTINPANKSGYTWSVNATQTISNGGSKTWTITYTPIDEEGRETITVISNKPTTFGFGGGGAFGGCPSMEAGPIGNNWTCTRSDFNLTGPHSISPGSISGYTFSVLTSATQSVADGGSITFTITYSVIGGPTPTYEPTPTPPVDTRSITVGAASCPAGASWTVEKGGSNPRTFSGSGTYSQYDEGDGVINGNYAIEATALGGYTINSITPATTQTINSSNDVYNITFNINCGAPPGGVYNIIVSSNIPTSWNVKSSNVSGSITADAVYPGINQTNAIYTGTSESVIMPTTPTPTPVLPTPPPPTTRSFIVDARTCPSGASWTITKSGGDPSFNGSGTTGIFQGGGSYIPNGNYTITPVVNGGYSYTVTPSLTQTINSGAGNYSRTFTITCDVPPLSGFDGSYTITDITLVSGYDAPTVSPTTTQTLSTGQTTITFNINYSVTAGCYNVDNINTWPDCSQFISQNIPATMTAGQSASAVMTFKNTGASTWNFYPYRLGTLHNDETWGVNRIDISSPAPAPGDSKTFNFNITAPNWPANTYAFNRRSMVKELVWFFGEASPDTNIQIIASPTPPPPPIITPSVSNVIVTPPNYCVSGPAATVNWTYSDPLGSPQSAYQVQIDNNASFVSPEDDKGKIISGSSSYFSGTGILEFNRNYNVRVTVWNSSDASSSWSSTVGFSTPNYAYPQVDFSFAPTNPAIDVPMQFTDSTTFYAPGPTTWSWLFGDGGSSFSQNPSHTYTTQGSYGATLTATDNAGHSCFRTKSVNIQPAIPVWKEVAPR